ncbi:hypothetical protein AHAS_Ahas12G0145400 [Arachis hypogaea]
MNSALRLFKLNTDGSVTKEGTAACDDIIRDHDSKFLAYFNANLGICSITQVELWKILLGLDLAINFSILNLTIELDSKITVKFYLKILLIFLILNLLLLRFISDVTVLQIKLIL